jgi:hypothetical protein
MQIPKEFTLFGQTIKVVTDKALQDGFGCKGVVSFDRNRITLQCGEINDAPESRMQQVFFHEVVHLIFSELGYSKERDDERMVDQVASALHQIITTSIYDTKKKDRDNAKTK